MKNQRPWMYVVLLGAALFVRVFLVFYIPYGQTLHLRLEGLNDEPAHYNYIRYIANHRAFPIQTHSARDPGAFEKNDFEYHQAPFYYMLSAIFYCIAGENHAFYVIRGFSCLMGILTLWVLYRVFQALQLDDRSSMAAVVFGAFSMLHSYYSALVSNDSLCWLVSMLIVYQCVTLFLSFTSNHSPKVLLGKSIKMALCLAIGMLTKSSVVIFFPLVLFVYIYGYSILREKKIILYGLFTLTAAVLLAWPWYVHNWMLYRSLFLLEVANGPFQRTLFTIPNFTGFLKQIATNFWFPMQHLKPSMEVKILQTISAAIILFHVIVALWFIVQSSNRLKMHSIFLVLLVVNIVAVIKFNLIWTNAEARFLFPSFAVIVYFMVVPYRAWLFALGKQQYLLPTIIGYSVLPYAYLFFV